MAGETVIIQSHRNSGLPAWIDVCLGSVRAWASDSGFRYAFFGDEMMDRVPLDWREKTAAHPQIAADIGRLYLLRDTLEQGAARAVWLDADVFVFAPQRMRIATESSFAFGREVWIEAEGSRYRARNNVHNALMVMKPGNPVLDFYIHTAEQILSQLSQARGPAQVPAQVIGPKLLGALNNFARFPLLDDVAMISPPVLADLAEGQGPALNLLRDKITHSAAAANLSASLVTDERLVEQAIAQLRANPELLSPSLRKETP